MYIILIAAAILAYLFVAVVPSGHAIGISFTLYLHRQLTHGSVQFRGWIANAMRLCIWLHAGVNRCQWVAVHRYHHKTSDTHDDPHSPVEHGLLCVPPNKLATKKPRWPLQFFCPQGFGLFWTNLSQYLKTAHNQEIVQKYGRIAHDGLERLITGRLFWLGPFVLTPLLHAALSGYLFYLIGLSPWWGLLVGPLTMAMILVWTIQGQAYINSFGHAAAERDQRTHDFSRDIRGPWFKNLILNLFAVGEQIHHGHHQNQRSWNFGPNDLGAYYIKLLRFFRLAQVHQTPI